MRSHLRSMAKRKVSDFLLREEGMVGNRSAFATAALVSTASLAMTLLVAPEAKACDNPRCSGQVCPDPNKPKPCWKIDINDRCVYWCRPAGVACGNGP